MPDAPLTDTIIDLKQLAGLTQDSRAVKPGFLFAAFAGEKVDGRDYIAQAIQNGATIILAPHGTTLPDGVKLTDSAGVQLVNVDNPRQAFAHLVAKFYPKHPERIVAVTGTNGKTSVVSFVQQIWEHLGKRGASIGTLSGGMTTADPVSLHQKLTALANDGITHLAMEASSHGLDQYRLDGAKISAAGFTNLSRDHLDYHKDMDEYFAAKSRLFTEILTANGIAVINADTPQALSLMASARGAMMDYGFAAENENAIKLISITPAPQGQKITILIKNETYNIDFNLVGEFQVMNALCALGLVLSEDGINTQAAINALSHLTAPQGRLQLVSGHPSRAGIYVDYAHTPDALETVLTALRPHTKGRLICIFGCGGDRDHGKRPQMGKIASRLADTVIVTDDNPRSEDPASIRAAILAACPSTALQIADRRAAIAHGVQSLTADDVLLVAGKGHEQGQIFATHTDPFDDVSEIQTAIQTAIQTMI